MNLYEDYTSAIKTAFNKPTLIKSMFTEQFSNYDGATQLSEHKTNSYNQFLKNQGLELSPMKSLKTIAAYMGIESIPDQTVGDHPDFLHLKGTSNKEYHYITSMFIDISRSTNLFKWYSLEQIFVITNTVQSAAIHTCALFGGHIQRLQGDGVFVYFGGKRKDKKQSMAAALNAAAFFTYFLETELSQVFDDLGVERITTRIGIDFGDDSDVMWAEFGIGSCTELTTISLHTSLASKLQSNAKPNGIMSGQNIKENLSAEMDYFDLKRNSKGEVERYVHQDDNNSFRYTQFEFDWKKYLSSFKWSHEDDNVTTSIPNLTESDYQDLAAISNVRPHLLINGK